jgi:hypothetical protein
MDDPLGFDSRPFSLQLGITPGKLVGLSILGGENPNPTFDISELNRALEFHVF